MEIEGRSGIGYMARATEFRTEAEHMHDPETKNAFLGIADSYELLAIITVSRRIVN